MVLTMMVALVLHPVQSDGEIEALVNKLRSPDAAMREEAAVALGKMGRRAQSAIPALGAALTPIGENEVPARAAEALASIGAAAVPELIKSLRSHNELVAPLIVEALAEVGPDAVQALSTAVNDDDRFLREAAMDALGQIGPPARQATPCLR